MLKEDFKVAFEGVLKGLGFVIDHCANLHLHEWSWIRGYTPWVLI